jgi:porin
VQDELGVAVAAARIGSQLAQSRQPLGSWAGETTLELTYLAQFPSGFALQPDIQYVVHPSAVRTIRNALVLGVRGEFSR